MKKFKTVSYKQVKLNECNIKLTTYGAYMQTDLIELAKNLSKGTDWVHVYDTDNNYNFSYNRRLGYSQIQALPMK